MNKFKKPIGQFAKKVSFELPLWDDVEPGPFPSPFRFRPKNPTFLSLAKRKNHRRWKPGIWGSGKTPHTLFLLQHLATHHPIFLSRGYGRKSSGFQLITSNSTTAEIGDEPKIIAHRFDESFRGGVCENRLFGLEKLHEKYPDSKVAVLDDAFQHRKLQSSFSTLLTPFSKPFWENKVFPKGSLRDLPKRAEQASIIVITGTPENFDPREISSKCSIRTEGEDHFFFVCLA